MIYTRFHGRGRHLVGRAKNSDGLGRVLFRFKMARKEYKFEDFLHLTVTSLQDFLSLRGLSKSGKKDELVARAFSAYELNVPVKVPQEVISTEVKKEYQQRLSHNNAPDPNEICPDQWIDDVTLWPDLDWAKLFSFILKEKAVDSEYIGKYKDQKAFSFSESGFVGTLNTYTLLPLGQ